MNVLVTNRTRTGMQFSDEWTKECVNFQLL